jgi:hypothetical protein
MDTRLFLTNYSLLRQSGVLKYDGVIRYIRSCSAHSTRRAGLPYGGLGIYRDNFDQTIRFAAVTMSCLASCYGPDDESSKAKEKM